MIETKQDSFQITLPSNASMETFKDNSANYFRTRLKKEIHLAGGPSSWEVALSAIQYPVSWPNLIKSGEIAVLVKPDEKMYESNSIPPRRTPSPPPSASSTSSSSPSVGGEVLHMLMSTGIGGEREAAEMESKLLAGGFWNYLDAFIIPGGIFNSVEDLGKLLVQNINNILQCVNLALAKYDTTPNASAIDLEPALESTSREKFNVDLKYDPVTFKANFTKTGNGTIQLLSTDNFLDRIFGLRPTTLAKNIQPPGIKPLNTYDIPCKSCCPCSLDKFDSLYVYSNVGQYQLIGDTEAQLLTVIPLLRQPTGNQKNVQLAYFACNPVYYIPVKMDVFQVIEIQLDTDKNEPFPFINNENEKVVVRLDFRRKTGSGGGTPFYLV